ncbi:MAG: hypothetical protein ALECFALPRED_009763 [Alectoria fallacina]|uniref:Uncharacterized protein n=1 Tax=Alectoria fallacina TaxID=1903189 RepID=A0A8H3PK98_9LECA|nr:MAG: hypothetical protein ALECFALPRED_009763 [Alectoria fallacina]
MDDEEDVESDKAQRKNDCEPTPAAKLLPVARTRHIATAQAGRRRGRARQARRAVAFLGVLDPGDRHRRRRRRRRRLAEGDAGLDRHTRRVGVRGTGEQAAVGDLVVAASGDVVADLRDRPRRLIRRQVVQAEQVRSAADLAAVARARFAAAGLADGGAVLEPGAAVALLAVLEAREAEVVAVGGGGTVALAGFDRHARRVGVRGPRQGARGHGVVGAAQVGPPARGELADGWGVD